MRAKRAEQTHILTERQFNYVKLLNLALNFNELKNRIISGYFYEVCINLGYAPDQNLGFEIDLDKDDRELKVTIVPNDVIEKALDNNK
jgi:hypothetical protein